MASRLTRSAVNAEKFSRLSVVNVDEREEDEMETTWNVISSVCISVVQHPQMLASSRDLIVRSHVSLNTDNRICYFTHLASIWSLEDTLIMSAPMVSKQEIAACCSG